MVWSKSKIAFAAVVLGLCLAASPAQAAMNAAPHHTQLSSTKKHKKLHAKVHKHHVYVKVKSKK